MPKADEQAVVGSEDNQMSVWIKLPLVMLAAAPFAQAATAHADQYDFVSVLDSNGVSYSNILDVIDLGKAVCSTVRTGQSVFSVDQAIAKVTLAGYTSNIERGIIIEGAANTMCPDIWPAIRAHQQAVQNPPASAPSPCVSDHPPAGCADGSY